MSWQSKMMTRKDVDLLGKKILIYTRNPDGEVFFEYITHQTEGDTALRKLLNEDSIANVTHELGKTKGPNCYFRLKRSLPSFPDLRRVFSEEVAKGTLEMIMVPYDTGIDSSEVIVEEELGKILEKIKFYEA